MNRLKQNSENFDKQMSNVTADMGSAMSAMANMQGGIGVRLGNGKEYLGSIYSIT